MAGFEFNLDLNKVKDANKAIAERAKEKWGDRADSRIVYMDNVGKEKAPDAIFYRLIPFDLAATNGLVYFDQQGWFIEKHRIVSAISIGEADEAYDMHLMAMELAKTDEGVAAILHKDNWSKYQFSSQYLAPIILLQPVVTKDGEFTGQFEIDPDPKKAIMLGCFRESLWTQCMEVIENQFNNPAKTVYGNEGRIWQSQKVVKSGNTRYETKRIEFTWNLESMSKEHLEEMEAWQTGGAYEYFKAGITPAEERLEWLSYVFQGGPRPKNARPLPNSQPKSNFGGGGGLMSKMK